MLFCMVRDFAGVIKLLLRGYSGLLGESIVITRILKIKREREGSLSQRRYGFRSKVHLSLLSCEDGGKGP